jgi:hypothetical protein
MPFNEARLFVHGDERRHLEIERLPHKGIEARDLGEQQAAVAW